MSRVSANGIQLEYESLGDPAAPVILLIMGLGMQLVSWPDPFCEALVARGFRVIRFDNRDSGLSTHIAARKRPGLLRTIVGSALGLPPRVPYTLEDMADDSVGLLDALGIAQAHIVGASMGGMIAQLLAARQPQRVLSLTSIMSSSGNPRYARPKLRALRAVLGRPAEPGNPESGVEHLIHVFSVIGSPGFPSDRDRLRQQIIAGIGRAYHPAGTTNQLLAVIANGDRRRVLKQISAPTLVLHGDADPLVPLAAGRDTARHIPGARLQVVAGMGHDLAPGVQVILVEAIARHCSA
ncbi:alpha/beta fold hydrolase [Niveibacterium sp. 24ML]|uniref:alpha/beta fold hydrolase n=1 Tax=Niveibacterium sp. 24ML TaxID=2985512 RepID=UPI0022719F64|nr:alpha/beta fold hydrolase [Niveibacterium sp. 24ML]MCX9156332.1 alpha/beta fold hydrolase [Niveibacterium sp. 24ML]